ncbi:CDF family Co(II)/Ni(II) efflux transporter DmeF [Inquilinus sp. CAU 1745]|uniref:CDF family Co(II)/Ni(II) efflux transporter DmeF n=1 Tax=Inquilinus sp. CAU 1745 TaxID=3140369 RepID=UPI00325B3D82
MHRHTLDRWQTDHVFGQDRPRAGERRTLIVVAVTAAMMAVEIAAGLAFGSMALLADGLHMGSHAVALGIAAMAYVYARRHAGNRRFAFGTGKVNALAGFTGALLLIGFTVLMAVESVARFLDPVPIAFDQAILVALLGLVVNGVCAVILGGHGHTHEHGHGHDHEHDHNLRSAYLHVLTDALTSILAIAGLLAAKYAGAGWADPAIGVLGALLVARWSWGLLKDTAGVLLDREAPAEIRDALRRAIEDTGDARVADLHVWSIGPAIHAAEVTLVARKPLSPDGYKALIPRHLGIVHLTVETNRCPDC